MKYLAILIGTLVLAGCSSTSEVVRNEVPYCYTSSTKILKDNSVASSETVVECTDKPNPRAIFDNGMDMNRCGWANQAYVLNGKRYLKQVMACQLQDGSWTYVPNHNSN
jgi:hypothetical protein